MLNKKNHIIILKKSTLYAFTICLMLMLAVCSESSVSAAEKALKLCAETIIPSLFPFFVLSQFLIFIGFANYGGKFLSPIMRPLFNTNGAGGIAFLIGLICGYPSGAKTISELYKAGMLEKKEAERLLPYCNNSGPLFIIGAVGVGILKDSQAGVFLYIVHILSAIITGICFRFFSTKKQKTISRLCSNGYMNTGEAFSKSIKDSVSSILSVCGFVVFFSSVTAPFRANLKNNLWGLIFQSIAEVTGGVLRVAESFDLDKALPLISAILGFGGVCVLLQVMGIVKTESLSMKPYFWGKLFQGGVSYVLCKEALRKNIAVSTFSVSNTINFETGNPGAAITSVFIICAFYFLILALRKNFKKD